MKVSRRACEVALVGCGAWGRFILRDLVVLGCRVTVVARSPASRRRATEGGAAGITDRVAALPQVDGVVVATPSATHAAVIDQVAGLGVPIFVEKPMTVDAADAGRLARALAGRLFVMDKWRYHPGIEALARIARTEALGPVVGLRTTRIGWGNPHADVDAVWHLAPHDLSIAVEILGAVPVPRTAVADRAGGAVGGLIGRLGDTPWHVLEVSSRSATRRREVHLLCGDGVAMLADGYSAHVTIMRSPGGRPGDAAPETLAVGTEMPLLRELRAFVEHLAGGPPPRSSALEGAAVVEALARLRALAG